MAIKKVQAKSGQMYDANSPQGQMIVNSATTGRDADFDSSSSSLGADVGMAETLQLIYGETQESSESLDNIEESLVDDGKETAEERAARLAKSNKDKKPNKFANALGSAKEKIGAGVGKLKGSLSGKFGLALLGGGLLLLNEYGDEIAGPDGWLTKFLKYMKEDLIPDIRALYEDLQTWWDASWIKVKGFFGFIEKTFTAIGAYMDKFDTDGIEGLSETEIEAMKTDIKDTTKHYIGGFFKEVISSVGGAILGLTFVGIVGKMAKASILASGLFAAPATAAAAAGGTTIAARLAAMKVGPMGYASIAGMLYLGVTGVMDASTRAAVSALDAGAVGSEENYKQYAASWLAGDSEGGWAGAFPNLVEKAKIGGGVGAGIGIAFGPAGMLVGGMVGMLVGAVGGAIMGNMGTDAMNKATGSITMSIVDTATKFNDWISSIAAATKAAIPGGITPKEAYDQAMYGNQGRLERENVKTEEKIAFLQSVVDSGVPGQPGTPAWNSYANRPYSPLELMTQIKMLRGTVKEKEVRIQEAPRNNYLNTLEDKQSEQQAALGTYRDKRKEVILQEGIVKNYETQSKPGYVKQSEWDNMKRSAINKLANLRIEESLLKKSSDSKQTALDSFRFESALFTDRMSPTRDEVSRINFLPNNTTQRAEYLRNLNNKKYPNMNMIPQIQLVPLDNSTKNEMYNSNIISNPGVRNDFWINYDLLENALK